MNSAYFGVILRHLRKLEVDFRDKELPDHELLMRFAAHRDEDAYAGLLIRHGSMVLNVCRGVLHNLHDAEDVFQATFLILAQKAGTINRRESVSAWLYKVAYRLSLKARAKAVRRQVHEPSAQTPPSADPLLDMSLRELRGMLYEELHRLPEKYRAPLVLCYLEEKTQVEAARLLGWTKGAVKGRLERGRDWLRGRLVRRGLELSLGLLARALAPKAEAAAVPTLLTDATLRAALAASRTALATVASAEVITLVQGACKTMLYSKLKIATVVVLAVSAATSGLGVLWHNVLAANAQEARQGEGPKRLATNPERLALVPFSPDAAPSAPARGKAPRATITVANASKIRELAHIDKDVRQIVWRRDGKQVAFIGWEQPVEIADEESFTLIRKVGAERKLIHFDFSPDPDRVAFSENGTKAELLTISTGQSIELNGGDDQPRMHFSPDGKFLATGGYGTITTLWCSYCGHVVRSIDAGNAKGGLTVVFSPDSKILAVGNRNSTTRLFDVSTGELLHILNKEQSHQLKFHPNGKTLAVAYVDGSVALWNVANGELLHKAESGAKEIYTLDWSPQGDILATAGLHGRLTLWNPKDLSILKELNVPEWTISIAFSPDGTRLLSAGGPDTAPSHTEKVLVWGLPQE